MNHQLNLNELWKVGSPPAKKIKKTREETLIQQRTYDNVGRQETISSGVAEDIRLADLLQLN